MTYRELKKYFEQNRDTLPQSVGSDYMLVRDVKKTVATFIGIVEAEIKAGADLKKSYPAKAAKENLLKIYRLLQDEANHGAKELKFSSFSNFKRQF